MFENNPTSHNLFKKTALAVALTTALGVSAQALADTVSGSMTGQFTLSDATGNPQVNGDSHDPAGIPGLGSQRTPVSGTFTYDLAKKTGTLTIAPFSFFGGGLAIAQAINFQAIGSIDPATGQPNGSGTLIGVQMGFNWNGNTGIPVTSITDAAGFLNSVATINPATFVNGTSTVIVDSTNCSAIGCAVSTTGNAAVGSPATIGAVPLAMTNYNTAGTTLNSLFPVTDDGIAGSPMTTQPFPGFGALFDFESMTIDTYTDTTSPKVTLSNTNISITQGTTFDPTNPPGVTITVVDNVDGTLNLADPAVCTITNPVVSNTPGNYSVTYDCMDSSGNTNSASGAVNPVGTLNVTVVAAGAPVITLTGPNPLVWEAAVTPYVDPGATCKDNNGTGNTIVDDGTPTSPFSLDTTALDVNTLGMQTVTWNCMGASANTSQPRTVDVQDTTPPVVTLTPTCDTGANVITHFADGTDPTPVATAIDPNFNTSLTPTQTGQTVDPNPVFGTALSVTFDMDFQVSDAAGNSGDQVCRIIQANPNPVASLNGLATVVLDSGTGFTDPGATCQDFADTSVPDASALADSPTGTIDTTTPDGTYTVTYTCTNSKGNTGIATRTVIVGAPFSASSTSGSNFTMPDPKGKFVGGAPDVFFSWTGSLYTSEAEAINGGPNMFMGSALPTPFFGFSWTSHDITAFAPGDYTFTTSRNHTQTLHVGENQIGAHMLFDWNGNNDIDVVLTWNLNQVYTGTLDGASDLGAKGSVFTLSTTDTVNVDGTPGDGIPGVPMVDGPFTGFSPDFNIKMTPAFTLPSVAVGITQGTTPVTSAVAAIATPVTLTATVNPDVNGVYTYAGPFTYDWSTSDAALLALNPTFATSGTGNVVGTFTFDPSTLPAGTAVTARAKVRDGATGLTSTVVFPLQIVADTASAIDSDADGIPDTQDAIDNTIPANATMQQVLSGTTSNTSFVMQSSAGKLVLGDLAASGPGGVFQAGVSASDIGIADNGVADSCVGGCFSFNVTGLATPGASVDVVLPLSAAIPANAGYRKLINGTWRDFITTGGNAIASTAGSMGNCPAPSDPAWTAGLTAGDLCVKLTIVDGGTNDADFLANGIVRDPGGVSGPSLGSGAIPGSVGSPTTGGGCTLSLAPASAGKYAEWWLLGGLLGWLGFSSHRRGHKRS